MLQSVQLACQWQTLSKKWCAVHQQLCDHVVLSLLCCLLSAKSSAKSTCEHACLGPLVAAAVSGCVHVQEALPAGSTAASGANTLAPALGNVLDFRDPVNNSKWTCASTSRDGEYVCGAAASKEHHVIHIWEAHGAAPAMVLEGPSVGLQCAAWHPDPSRCVVATLQVSQQLCKCCNHNASCVSCKLQRCL